MIAKVGWFPVCLPFPFLLGQLQCYDFSLLLLLLQYISYVFFLSVGCDDLVSAVFEMAKTLSRLQLSEEEMALFTATVLLSPGSFTRTFKVIFNFYQSLQTFKFTLPLIYFIDRPWLTDAQKVKKLQEKVYVALQHWLHKSGANEEKLSKVLGKNPKIEWKSKFILSQLLHQNIQNKHMQLINIFMLVKFDILTVLYHV